jgi:hypothetical protein
MVQQAAAIAASIISAPAPAHIVEGTMSDMYNTEIEKAVQHASRTGETLFVGLVASRIATACGAPARLVAEELTRAGIQAGVTMQFGAPE